MPDNRNPGHEQSAESACGLRTRLEHQCHAIVAIPFPGRFRTIFENMSVMAATSRAMILSSRYDQLEVGAGFYTALDGGVKTRPTGSTVEFCVGVKNSKTTAAAFVDTIGIILVQLAAEGRFSSLLSQYVIFIHTQQLSPLRI